MKLIDGEGCSKSDSPSLDSSLVETSAPQRPSRHFLGFELFRRTTPIDRHWGGKRGQIIDRYYIETFLTENAHIRGHVLDFGDETYARHFGGSKVSKIDVMNLVPGNPSATIVADLANCGHIPSGTFDCILCTQVLLLVFDLKTAIRSLYRILKPGGVLLLTAPGIQKISRGDMGDRWRILRPTTLSMRRLFEEVFPPEQVQVRSSGNVLTATAFLHGLSVRASPRRSRLLPIPISPYRSRCAPSSQSLRSDPILDLDLFSKS